MQESKYGIFTNDAYASGAALISLISLLVVTPVVAFYLLLDWDKMVATIYDLVPPRHRDTVAQLARQIDAALAGFLRGQSLVCLFLGLWYGIGLSLIGLNFGLLIGLSAGLLSFIPYVGSLTALVLSVSVAIVQDWPQWNLLLMALAIFVTGQFLEGNILSPKLVGEFGRPASGLADFCAARLRQPVRLHRTDHRRSARRRRRGHPALRHWPLPGEQALPGNGGRRPARLFPRRVGSERREALNGAPSVRRGAFEGGAGRAAAARSRFRSGVRAGGFLVSASNENAFAMIELWPRWPDHALLLLGPPGAGKSHLGAIWADRAGAAVVPADALACGEARTGGEPLLLEDVETIGSGETALFHLLNRMRERGAALLLTARTPPDSWAVKTPDLLSRLRRAPTAAIGSPDDSLMRAVLVKLLVDRQLVIDAEVVEYAAMRLDRSLGAARAFIDALDREALARKSRITRTLAGGVLDAMADED